jgi:hypothetical protein
MATTLEDFNHKPSFLNLRRDLAIRSTALHERRCYVLARYYRERAGVAAKGKGRSLLARGCKAQGGEAGAL